MLAWSKSPFSTGDSQAKTILSPNQLSLITQPDGTKVLYKKFLPERIYIPRLKILGAIAYALFDDHLGGNRVTPDICALSPNEVRRQWIDGFTGSEWRGDVYRDTQDLNETDELIYDAIKNTPSAARIALLDLLFMSQDRSGANWVYSPTDGNFWAIDNMLFWSYRGRSVNKKAIETGKVSYKHHPMIGTMYQQGELDFTGNLFAILWANREIPALYLLRLMDFNWQHYLDDLKQFTKPLGYPSEIVNDWRIDMIRQRMKWLLETNHYPSIRDVFAKKWEKFIRKPKYANDVWQKEWELG